MKLTFRLLSDEELDTAATILLQMNEGKTAPEIADCLRLILARYPNYACLGAWEGQTLLGVSGYWIAHRVWCGKYIEPDNVAVAKEAQSRGIGAALMAEIERIGRSEGCDIIALDAYTTNRKSHRFYHRLGFEIYGFHFVKPLTG